jgi:hypothetical protein
VLVTEQLVLVQDLVTNHNFVVLRILRQLNLTLPLFHNKFVQVVQHHLQLLQ